MRQVQREVNLDQDSDKFTVTILQIRGNKEQAVKELAVQLAQTQQELCDLSYKYELLKFDHERIQQPRNCESCGEPIPTYPPPASS